MLGGAANAVVNAIASAVQGAVAGKATRDLAVRAGRANTLIAEREAEASANIWSAHRQFALALAPVAVLGVCLAGLAMIVASRGRRGNLR